MDFHPYTKEMQLQKKPRVKEKRPRKKKGKLEIYKGRTIPSAKQRGAVSKKEYARAIEAFGDSCVYCGNPYIEMHHVRFRSQGGRGKYRNLMPLCKEHHNRAHTDREFSEMLRDIREKKYGPWYWADKYDLFKAGLIPNTTDAEFEKFMKLEEERCRGDADGEKSYTISSENG